MLLLPKVQLNQKMRDSKLSLFQAFAGETAIPVLFVKQILTELLKLFAAMFKVHFGETKWSIKNGQKLGEWRKAQNAHLFQKWHRKMMSEARSGKKIQLESMPWSLCGSRDLSVKISFCSHCHCSNFDFQPWTWSHDPWGARDVAFFFSSGLFFVGFLNLLMVSNDFSIL